MAIEHICPICDKPSNGKNGELVRFQDYVDYSNLTEIPLGQPGELWFCSDHLAAAMRLSNVSLAVALRMLQPISGRNYLRQYRTSLSGLFLRFFVVLGVVAAMLVFVSSH